MMYTYFPIIRSELGQLIPHSPIYCIQDNVRTDFIFHLKPTLDRICLTIIYIPNAFKHLCTTLLMIWPNVTISQYDIISYHMYPIICTLYSPHRENRYKNTTVTWWLRHNAQNMTVEPSQTHSIEIYEKNWKGWWCPKASLSEPHLQMS